MDAPVLEQMRASGETPDGRMYTEETDPAGERVAWSAGFAPDEADARQDAVNAEHAKATARDEAQAAAENERRVALDEYIRTGDPSVLLGKKPKKGAD